MTDQPLTSPVGLSDIKKVAHSNFEQNLNVVAKGGGITFAGKLFLNVIRFAAALLLARLLGAEQLGLYSLSLSALNISVGLALFGLDAALVRFTAVMAGRRDEDGTWDAIQVGMGLSLILSAVLGTLLYALAFVIADKVFHDPRLAPLLQLTSVFVPLLILNDQLGNALKGFKNFKQSVAAQYVVQPVTRLVLIGVLALIRLDAAAAVAAYGLASLTASAAMFLALNRKFPLKRPLAISRQNFRDMLAYAFPVWLSGLMVRFQANIQALFLGTLGSMAGVGIFSVASQITAISGEFSSSINTTSKPVVAELHDRNDIRQMERLYQLTNKWVVMVQLPIFLVMLTFPQALLSIFGEGYADGAAALIILAVADFINVSTGMGGVIIDMAGYTKLKLFNSFIRLALYIFLDYLLIPRWGLAGAALAVLVGEGSVNLLRLVQVYLIFRILPFNASFAKPLVATAAALAGVILTNTWLPGGPDLLHAALGILVMFAAYTSVLLALGLSEEEINLFKSIFRKIRKVVDGGNGRKPVK